MGDNPSVVSGRNKKVYVQNEDLILNVVFRNYQMEVEMTYF